MICIDRQATHGFGIVWNHIPHGAEDFTGDRPLAERVRWLRHARAFIGLSSGLSWLAWAAGTPVVMISGFTHPVNEFATPYRVINYHACNSCWNDVRHRFDHKNFLMVPAQRRYGPAIRVHAVDHGGSGDLDAGAGAGTGWDSTFAGMTMGLLKTVSEIALVSRVAVICAHRSGAYSSTRASERRDHA